jgi:hypothetical protein
MIVAAKVQAMPIRTVVPIEQHRVARGTRDGSRRAWSTPR